MSHDLVVADIAQALFPVEIDEKGIEFPEPLKVRELIAALEKNMNAAAGVQIQIKTTHRLGEGIYLREVFLPAGTLVVGKLHRKSCMSILSHGEMTLVTEHGAKKLKAPFTSFSKPGTKRVAFAHSDCVFTTIHATNETDIKKIEAEVLSENYDDVVEYAAEMEDRVSMEGFILEE